MQNKHTLGRNGPEALPHGGQGSRAAKESGMVRRGNPALQSRSPPGRRNMLGQGNRPGNGRHEVAAAAANPSPAFRKSRRSRVMAVPYLANWMFSMNCLCKGNLFEGG